VQQTDAVCNAAAYMLKLTVGLYKPLLLNVKKKICQVVTVSQITSFETGGETSRKVAKRPGIETSNGAKKSKWRNVQVANWQSSETSRNPR